MSKKISGDYGWILPAGLLVGAGYLIYKLFPGLLGPSAAAQNAAAAGSTVASGTSSTLQTLAAAGTTPSLTPAQAAALANDILQNGVQVQGGVNIFSSNAPYVENIFKDLSQCTNDADLYLIMQNFGVREAPDSEWSVCALAGFDCSSFDLQSFVVAVLNSASITGAEVSDLDALLQANGLTYQF